MKNFNFRFQGLIIVFFSLLIIISGCKKDSEDINNDADKAFKNTAWVQTGDSEFEIVGIHENGSMMAVNTNSSETSVLSVVYKNSPESSGFYVWFNSNGYPEKAYVNSNIILFDNFTENTVDIAIIRETGNIEIIRNISFNDPDFKSFSSLKELSSTESLGDVLRWAGHGLAVAACVVEIAGTISTGGLLAPIAVIGCGSAIAGIVLEFVAEDNTAIQASAAAISAFGGAAGCITSGGLSCPAYFVSTAGAVATAAENSNSNLQSSIQEAQNELNQGTGTTEFKITLNKYSETEDLEQAVRNEFGNNYAIADWYDVKAVAGSSNIEEWANTIGITGDNKSMMVTVNGAHFYNGNRHYFISRHDHVTPSGFLVHDHIDNHFIDLGSWYGINIKILCKKINK